MTETMTSYKTKLAGLLTAAMLVAMLVAALLLALSATAESAGAAFPGTNGKVAFYTQGDVWVMNTDGTLPTRLTNKGGTHDSG